MSVDPNVPALVERLTDADGSALPLMSKTFTVTVVAPPDAGTLHGLQLILTPPTAAVPTRILSAPLVPVVAPPEVAVIVAVPLLAPGRNLTETIPLASVSACAG